MTLERPPKGLLVGSPLATIGLVADAPVVIPDDGTRHDQIVREEPLQGL